MPETFDAWWLPGTAVGETRTLRVGELECRYPVPTPALTSAAMDALRVANRELARRQGAAIVDAVDAAAARFLDPEDDIRDRAERLLGAATGYSPPMVRLILDRMSGDWRAGPTRRLLAAELGDPAVLDGFVPVAPGGDARRVRAYGPGLVFHVFAGNVPGVSVTSLIRSLLVKAPALGKLASGQPVLPVLFAEALAGVDAALGRALALTYWPGGAEEVESAVLEAVDAVVAYGGDAAVESLRRRVPPDTRLVIHGPRFSVGLIGSGALDDPDLPARAARAVAAFDQHGCVSPHTLWVEDAEGGAAEAFAERLAEALRSLERELPRGAIAPEEAAAIQQERGAAEMRAQAGGVRVLADAGTRWTVILDDDPTFRISCLNRFIRVQPVASLDRTPDLLAGAGSRLQSVAIAAEPHRRTELADALARVGATRITTFDALPWPPPEWHHDGRGPLRELVRWVDLEG